MLDIYKYTSTYLDLTDGFHHWVYKDSQRAQPVVNKDGVKFSTL